MASLSTIATVAPTEPAGTVVPAWRLEAKREDRARRIRIVRSTIMGAAALSEEPAA